MVTPRLRCLSLGLLILSLGCARPAPNAEEKAPPATVKWEVASGGALEEWTELVGTTVPLPDREAHVSAAVGGQVVSVFGTPGSKAAEGRRVEKGTVLVQLDTSVLEANLAKVQAGEDVIRQEERQAQYAVEFAKSDVDRLRKLMEEEEKRPVGSRRELVTEVDRLKADYALKDAQAKLQGAKSKLIASAKDVDAIRAEIKLHTLSAPVGGRLGRLLVAPGQTVSAGATVTEIVDLDEQIDVLCFVPPSLVRRLQVGQQAESGPVEQDPSEPRAQGQVEYIAEQAEPETGNFAVKVRFDNKDAHLRANGVIRLRVQTQPTKECLSLPESAINESEEIPTVVIVENIKTEKNADGKEETSGTARKLQVVLGLRDRPKHQVEIIRLEDPEKKWHGEVKDQQFVVEGGQGLQTDDKVKLEVEGD
jgi:RND family efflux transporter MFP subunit